MPALRMKSKLSTECVRQGSLHACHKSNKISKVSHSQVKAFQQPEELDSSTQENWISQKLYSTKEVSGEITGIIGANDFQENGASTNLLMVSQLSDPISTMIEGPTSAASPCDMETIFSPTLEHNDSQLIPANNSNAVRDENQELPLLIADDSDDGSCDSSDLLICDELDFYISENVPASPFDSIMGFTNDASTVLHERMNSEIIIDMAERCMIRPFLEKTVETCYVNDEPSLEEIINYDDTYLYLALHQMQSSNQETEENYVLDDLEGNECSDQHSLFRDLPELCETNSSIIPIWLPNAEERRPITLVLDLDETLVHSTLEHCDDADFTFPVFFNMKQHDVYVRRRPYLQMFLERVAEMFEIVIFTASQSIYAEQLLDKLDPYGKLISQRIYRESCTFSDGSITKDLTILGVDLAKVAIIDNSPQVFRLQVNNGIPIKSWFDDPTDQSLLQLLPFLETLVDVEDVRPIIAKKFGKKD
ncbi:uncharacterized protein [Typha angustifolia]|uniref:uncharacterized protein isoform X1 n=1 Tax=Typha angustifolia TaxID=59011 RepID=UPI003C2F09E2